MISTSHYPVIPGHYSRTMAVVSFCCSVTKSVVFYDPIYCSTPGFLFLHYLPEFAQTHVHQVGDPIQQSHPLISLMLYEITNMSFPLKKAVSMEQTGLDHQGYTRLHLKELSGFVALASTTMHRKIYLRIPLSLKQVCHFIYDSNKFTFSTSLMDQEFCIPFV